MGRAGGVGDGLATSVAGEVGTDGASAGEADAVAHDAVRQYQNGNDSGVELSLRCAVLLVLL